MSSLVLITGSRDWKDISAVYEELSTVPEWAIFMQGGCPIGADHYARMYCQKSLRPMITIHADWKKHGKAAGPIRNRKMLGYWPELVIGFCLNGSRGTTDCIDEAKARGIPFRLIEAAK